MDANGKLLCQFRPPSRERLQFCMKQSCCLQLEALRLCNLRNASGMSMNGDPERVCVCVHAWAWRLCTSRGCKQLVLSCANEDTEQELVKSDGTPLDVPARRPPKIPQRKLLVL